MSWEDILKISRREATELGDKYAPEDMKQFRKEKILPVFRSLLSELKRRKIPYEYDLRFGEIIRELSEIASDIEDAPNFRGKSKEQVIELLEEYLGE